MPTPLGHALGGFIAGWLVAPSGSASLPVDTPASTGGREAAKPPGRAPGDAAASMRTLPSWWPRHASCGTTLRAALFAAVGMAADLDLLVGRHHQFTHSVGAVLIVLALALIALRRRRGGLLLAAAVAAAYASHPLLDWLGEDATAPRGITALWPFTGQYYLSHADLFRGISREPWRPGVIWHDLLAIVGEVVFLAPLAVGAWWLRRPVASRQNLPVSSETAVQRVRSAGDIENRGESRTIL